MNHAYAPRKPDARPATFHPSGRHSGDIWQALGVARQGAALNSAIAQGFSYQVLVELAARAGLSEHGLGELLGIARTTLLRRRKAGYFTSTESDRLYRTAKIYQAAVDLFEDNPEAAGNWLKQPIKGLGDDRPIDLLQTMAGTERVLNLIGRLEYGIPA